MRIAIASDHAGFHLKELLLNRLAAEPDLTLVDLGTHAAAPPVDYPDYAQAAAEAVVRGDVDRAIMVCGFANIASGVLGLYTIWLKPFVPDAAGHLAAEPAELI